MVTRTLTGDARGAHLAPIACVKRRKQEARRCAQTGGRTTHRARRCITTAGPPRGKLEAIPLRTDTFELSGLHLTPGEGRRLELSVAIAPFSLGGEHYMVTPEVVPASLDVSRITGGGYALRLRFTAALSGPCMRCLNTAEPSFEVDAREVWQPGGDDQLSSPYVEQEVLDLEAWARDALALALPTVLLCSEDCAGLCPVCGIRLAEAGPDHGHEPTPDPRWAKLNELRFE